MCGQLTFSRAYKLDESFAATRTLLMMIIAFINIKSGSVPLIEGLCTQIYYLRFEIIGGLCSHLLLFQIESKKKSS